MVQVIDLARVMREKHGKALKLPLKKLIVVHSNEEFLADMTGELREYVVEEMNVQELVLDNLKSSYFILKAEPNWQELGKRLGKSMGKVGGKVKQLGMETILKFEAGEAIEVEGFELKGNDLKVVREFKLPEGVTEEQMDATSDGDVHVVIDLEVDQEMMAAGHAREIVNKLQKMRKKAGCLAGEKVEMYCEVKGTKEGADALTKLLTEKEDYFTQSLGTRLLPMAERPGYVADLLTEAQTVGDTMEMVATLTHPVAAFSLPALQEASAGDASLAEDLGVWITSRDPQCLRKEASAANGRVTVTVSGKECTLQENKHFFYSVTDSVGSKS
ncbi:hypothetical protein CYMTET_28996 [Cymbomonas tetramitiformis]|uniref:Isoleucine--tRNA ligase n=1 Tax=Cymbomonas tetramitiformis TaxID=36881 RepID=A0AAE0FLQ7_9CHLO|nr:hypothetical protein CYMTET_28996 [Cymbomonas tetramitiformis]